MNHSDNLNLVNGILTALEQGHLGQTGFIKMINSLSHQRPPHSETMQRIIALYHTFFMTENRAMTQTDVDNFCNAFRAMKAFFSHQSSLLTYRRQWLDAMRQFVVTSAFVEHSCASGNLV